MDKAEYNDDLIRLQTALIESQAWAIEQGQRMVVVFEGRDAAGKDGSIGRIIRHAAKRETRIVALPKPSDRERTQWYFQRYIAHLPAAGEWVLFNRSWYNRGGVEPVMGFCTPEEHESFLRNASDFERLIVESGAKLVKFWLDISKKEQAERLESRRTDPLKRFKTSPLDLEAQKRWDAYTAARDEMLTRTHSPLAPWTIVRANHKKAARLNILRHLIAVVGAPAADRTEAPDRDVVFPFEADALKDGRLER